MVLLGQGLGLLKRDIQLLAQLLNPHSVHEGQIYYFGRLTGQARKVRHKRMKIRLWVLVILFNKLFYAAHLYLAIVAKGLSVVGQDARFLLRIVYGRENLAFFGEKQPSHHRA